MRVSASDTSKVPNASPTAASSGSDLNGMAARAAARTLRERLAAFAARQFDCDPQTWHSAGGIVHCGGQQLPFAELVDAAYHARVPLSATGFYATPKIHYDRKTLSGPPVLLLRVRRGGLGGGDRYADRRASAAAVDILHDVGKSLNPAIDRGQIEGGFIQGWGWLTMEELWLDAEGELETHAPSTYKIPTSHDVPWRFDVAVPRRAESRGHDLPLEGGRRAAVDARAVGLPRAARRDRERRRLPARSCAGRSGDARADPGRHRGDPKSRAALYNERGKGTCAARLKTCRRSARKATFPIACGDDRSRSLHHSLAHGTRTALASGPRAVLVVVAIDAGLGAARGRRCDGRLRDIVCRIDRRRASRVRGDAHRARGARDTGVAAAPGSCAFRWPRASANAAAAWRRSRFRRSSGRAPWVDAAIACARTGAPFALLSSVGAHGPGARLIVTGDDARGTLGDAALDSAAIALARTRLAGAAPGAALVKFAQDARETLLIQVERPDPFAVLLFGNGHVGRALVEVLGVLPAQRALDRRARRGLSVDGAVQRRDRRLRHAGGRARRTRPPARTSS